jgi:hypothetical protein
MSITWVGNPNPHTYDIRSPNTHARSSPAHKESPPPPPPPHAPVAVDILPIVCAAPGWVAVRLAGHNAPRQIWMRVIDACSSSVNSIHS